MQLKHGWEKMQSEDKKEVKVSNNHKPFLESWAVVTLHFCLLSRFLKVILDPSALSNFRLCSPQQFLGLCRLISRLPLTTQTANQWVVIALSLMFAFCAASKMCCGMDGGLFSTRATFSHGELCWVHIPRVGLARHTLGKQKVLSHFKETFLPRNANH